MSSPASTSIVFWNIQQFSTENLGKRIDAILDIVKCANPSIIAIQEVVSIKTLLTPGTFIFQCAGGYEAIMGILNALNNNGSNDNWSLVPPVNLGIGGKVEAIAVFYNNRLLQFQGPNYLSCLTDNTGTPLFLISQNFSSGTIQNIQDYNTTTIEHQTHFKNCMPSTPSGVVHNGMAINQSQLAPQCQFYDDSNQLINFPTTESRSPLLTKFYEISSGRTINLFTVHTSPDSSDAAVVALSKIREIKPSFYSDFSKTVNVIGGDFNVDPDNGTDINKYNGLLNLGYALHLNPSLPGTNVPSFCKTHYNKNKESASPYNAKFLTYSGGPYPALGYLDKGLDNVLSCYGASAGKPSTLIPPTTVLNQVVGSPYQSNCPYTQALNAYPSGINLLNALGIAQSGLSPPQDGIVDLPCFEFRFKFADFLALSDHLPILTQI